MNDGPKGPIVPNDAESAVAEPVEANRSRRSRVLRALGGSLLGGLGAVMVAAAFIRVPYVIISPGAATPLDDQVVEVSGARTYEHRGGFLYLTVRVTDSDPNVYRWLLAQLDGDATVQKKQEVIGCASYDASARLNDLLMQESQDVAKTVALRRLGHPVEEMGRRVVIRDVVCDGPSRGALEPGDIIVGVDGKPVTEAKQVRPLIRAHRPGERLVLTIERDGKRRDVHVRLGRLRRVAFLGIVSQTLTDPKLPFDVRIDTRRVSGPSAGLAFTLAIIDDLTPGDLTGGRRVAVTGSINPDGTVGIVGGVEQKAVTARNAGARLLLVPVGEAQAARDQVGDDLRVVAVGTVDEALEALRTAGGKGVPLPPPSTITSTTTTTEPR